MSLESLTPSLSALRDDFPAPLPGDRSGRRRAADEEVPAPAAAFNEIRSPPSDPAAFAAIIRTDLTGLGDSEPHIAELVGHFASSAHEFLGAFSSLLSSVASGNAAAARDAATELQLELFGGPSALAATSENGDDAQARMLDDILSLIRFARLGDIGSAEASAHLMGRHLQTALLAPARAPKPSERVPLRRRIARAALLQEPASLVQGATAAYEILMELDAGANAA